MSDNIPEEMFNKIKELVPMVHTNIIVTRKDKILLLNRENCWQFPGGRLERNESVDSGMRRELFEETGLKAINYCFCGIVEKIEKDSHEIILLYKADSDDGNVILSDEHSEYVWIEKELLKDFITNKWVWQEANLGVIAK